MDRGISMCGELISFEEFTVEQNQDFLLYLMAVGAEIVQNIETGKRTVYFDMHNGLHGGKVLYKYADRFSVLTKISGYSIELPSRNTFDDIGTISNDGNTCLYEITDFNKDKFMQYFSETTVFHGKKLEDLINLKYTGGENA